MHWFSSALHSDLPDQSITNMFLWHTLCLWTHTYCLLFVGRELNTVMLRFGYWLLWNGCFGNACYRSGSEAKVWTLQWIKAPQVRLFCFYNAKTSSETKQWKWSVAGFYLSFLYAKMYLCMFIKSLPKTCRFLATTVLRHFYIYISTYIHIFMFDRWTFIYLAWSKLFSMKYWSLTKLIRISFIGRARAHIQGM